MSHEMIHMKIIGLLMHGNKCEKCENSKSNSKIFFFCVENIDEV